MKKLNSKELRNFTCTENYYSSPYYKFVYTDGVKYVAQNGSCHWLLSLISLNQSENKIRQNKYLQEIQFWTLTVDKDQSGKLVCEQDEGITILEKIIHYTEFPLPEIKFYLSNMFLYWESEGEPRGNNTEKYGTLILPSEY